MNEEKQLEFGYVESFESDLEDYKKSNPNLAKKIKKTMHQVATDVAANKFRSRLEVEYVESHKPIKSARIDGGHRLSFELVNEPDSRLLLFRAAGEHDKVYKSPSGSGKIIYLNDFS